MKCFPKHPEQILNLSQTPQELFAPHRRALVPSLPVPYMG
jgi:hypothetical protein